MNRGGEKRWKDVLAVEQHLQIWSKSSYFQSESTLFEFGWRHQRMSSWRRRWWSKSGEKMISYSIETHWTTIGMSMANDHQLDLGLYSRDTHLWRNLYSKDICVQERIWQRIKPRVGLITIGRRCGRKCPKALEEKQDSNVTQKTPSWMLHADWEEFTTLLPMIRNLTPSSRRQEENWKRLWNLPCRVKHKDTPKEEDIE